MHALLQLGSSQLPDSPDTFCSADVIQVARYTTRVKGDHLHAPPAPSEQLCTTEAHAFQALASRALTT
jgi:hypothetical protein